VVDDGIATGACLACLEMGLGAADVDADDKGHGVLHVVLSPFATQRCGVVSAAHGGRNRD
jgi:hypothetical protein